MKCLECNSELEIMYRPEATLVADGTERVEVLGLCRNCHHNATWIIDTYPSGEIKEYDLKRYFFG